MNANKKIKMMNTNEQSSPAGSMEDETKPAAIESDNIVTPESNAWETMQLWQNEIVLSKYRSDFEKEVPTFLASSEVKTVQDLKDKSTDDKNWLGSLAACGVNTVFLEKKLDKVIGADVDTRMVPAILLEESERLRKEDRRLLEGTYYATVKEVWGIESKDYKNNAFFTALIRTKPPSFKGRGTSMDAYNETRKFAWNKDLVAADHKTESRNSTASSTKIWPTDIFGQELDGAEVAHLIPASPKNASLYIDAVIWALGFSIDKNLDALQKAIHEIDSDTLQKVIHEIDWETLQKTIHGAKPKGTGGRREAHTGIKHSVSNKIRLVSQCTYYDKNPCVLIIPILDLNEAKGWNGEGYNALVMCGEFDGTDASKASRMIQMTTKGRIASESEIEKARKFFEAVILGMAYSLLICFQRKLSFLDIASEMKFYELRNHFLNQTGILGVVVPKARPVDTQDLQPVEALRVRVVEFSSHAVFNKDEAKRHPAPDPLLLAVKAAINWSRQNNQPLRAAAEPQEEEDELDDLANKQYLQAWADQYRPKTRDDLARGLGQPLGYQGDDGVTA
jgi:hypothetical protein